jgi:hypothetical protein
MIRGVSEAGFFRGIAAAAVLLSLGGVVYAVRAGHSETAGRGGALADAIALAALFGTRNYAADTYYALTQTLPAQRARILNFKTASDIRTAPITDSAPTPAVETKVAELEGKLNAMEKRLALDSDGQALQNKCLAFATFVGTIFWGFGDIFAGWFIPR